MGSTGRLWLCILALMIGIAPGWAVLSRAQDATPGTGGARSLTTDSTEVGDPVTYVDAEGVEHGVVVVSEVVDPFTDFAEGYDPDEGTRYVLLNVSFEATGAASFDANPSDLLLRDADGYVWSSSSVNRGSEPAVPDLQSQTLASGNRISGAITFVVPEDTPLSEIFYQPESGHLILLADLSEDDAEAPAVGDEVTYVDAEGVEQGIVAVTEVIDPFTDYSEGYEPAEDTRYVVINVSFEATGEGSFDASPSDLVMRDANGFLWAPTSVNRGEDPAVPDAQSQTLASGNKISGAVGFIVPADTSMSEIYYQPESGLLILLADLDSEGSE